MWHSRENRLQDYETITLPLRPPTFPSRGACSPSCADTDVVIHAASYVGSDPRLAHAINESGTSHVIEQCREAGVARLIYVSTCSVYGSGPHRGILESEAGYHPASVASASRAVAEQLVLGYGGEVVRPNLVFGAGDRWFVPGLLKLMKVAGGWPGDGSALLSLIGVEALGRLLSGLALAPRQPGQRVPRRISGTCSGVSSSCRALPGYSVWSTRSSWEMTNVPARPCARQDSAAIRLTW